MYIYIYIYIFIYIPTGFSFFRYVLYLSCKTGRFASTSKCKTDRVWHAVPIGLLPSTSRPNFDRFHNPTAAPFPCVTNFYVGVVTLCFTSISGTGSFSPWLHAYRILSQPGLSMHFLVPTGLFFTGFSMFFNTGRV